MENAVPRESDSRSAVLRPVVTTKHNVVRTLVAGIEDDDEGRKELKVRTEAAPLRVT